MKRVVAASVAALTCTGLLAACGTTDPECVAIPSEVIDTIKSGNPGTTNFGDYGGVETTIADRPAYIVAVELDGRYSDNDLDPGVWRVGWSNGRANPILAANDWAAAVTEWPRDRDEDEQLVPVAEACI